MNKNITLYKKEKKKILNKIYEKSPSRRSAAKKEECGQNFKIEQKITLILNKKRTVVANK
ncbi:MAG: hypothetical protein GY820_32090 [Gammaproteobacteria bacterium]|nr:hypothetical protein [Gammaproteobacteria bacterium]